MTDELDPATEGIADEADTAVALGQEAVDDIDDGGDDDEDLEEGDD